MSYWNFTINGPPSNCFFSAPSLWLLFTNGILSNHWHVKSQLPPGPGIQQVRPRLQMVWTLSALNSLYIPGLISCLRKPHFLRQHIRVWLKYKFTTKVSHFQMSFLIMIIFLFFFRNVPFIMREFPSHTRPRQPISLVLTKKQSFCREGNQNSGRWNTVITERTGRIFWNQMV